VLVVATNDGLVYSIIKWLTQRAKDRRETRRLLTAVHVLHGSASASPGDGGGGGGVPMGVQLKDGAIKFTPLRESERCPSYDLKVRALPLLRTCVCSSRDRVCC